MVRALNGKWDVFISHASEDKEDFVRSLAEGLKDRGLRVWFDETSLTVGDSLRESIDRGLSQSRFGIVVLSPHFFSKQWPKNELNGLATREAGGLKIILPVWHNITLEKIREASPILADRVAASSSKGLDRVIQELMQAIAPPAAGSRPAASAGAPPEVPQQPAAGTNVSSGDPKLDKLAADCLKDHLPQISWAANETDAQHLYDELKVLYPRLEKCGLITPMLNPRQSGNAEYDNTWHGFHKTSIKVLYRKIRNESFDLGGWNEDFKRENAKRANFVGLRATGPLPR